MTKILLLSITILVAVGSAATTIRLSQIKARFAGIAITLADGSVQIATLGPGITQALAGEQPVAIAGESFRGFVFRYKCNRCRIG